MIHNATVNSTTNGSGRVMDMTAEQIHQLDAAYWFVPGEGQPHGRPVEEYVFRGVRTGEKPPPPGYGPDDFTHPTLKAVLDEFPDVPINIEIKGPDDDPNERRRIAELLADLLTTEPYASRDDIIVVSFNEDPLAHFHSLAPGVDLAASEDTLEPWAIGKLLGQPVTPLPAGTVALQVPPTRTVDLGSGPVELHVPELLLGPPINAHQEGYAVHVWTNARSDEDPAVYGRLIEKGVDGIMTTTPARLHAYLCEAQIPRPDGSPRCAGPEPEPEPEPEPLTATLTVPNQRAKAALRLGIRTTPGCSRTCDLRLEAKVSKRAAKRRGLWPKKRKGKELSLGVDEVDGFAVGGGQISIDVRKRLRKPLRKLRGKLPFTVSLTATTADGASASASDDARLAGKRAKRKRHR